MQLVYDDSKKSRGFSAPGSGWPESNHTEPDPNIAEAKIESGWYHEKGQKKKSTEAATKRVSERHPQTEADGVSEAATPVSKRGGA